MSNKFYTAAGLTLTVNGSNIANLQTWNMTEPTTTLQDVTNFGSEKVGGVIVKEQIPSEINPGKFAGTAYYIPTDPGLAALRSAYGNTTLSTFTLTLPMDSNGNVQVSGGDVITWEGYVTSYPTPEASSPEKPIMYKIDCTMINMLSVTTGS